MLVLERDLWERVRIGRDIWVSIERVEGRRVRLGFCAPPDVKIMREELLDDDENESREDAA